MRSLLATTLVAFALAAVVHGRGLFELRWAPTRHTWAAIGAAALPAFLSALSLLLPRGSLAFDILLWILIFGLCGFGIPWGYVFLIESRDPSALGVTRRRWAASVLVSLLFAGGAVLSLVRQVDVTQYDLGHLLRTAFQLNVGGLFELFLYCGFLHLRLRSAFGPLPAVIASATLYSLWHIGTELPLHPDPPQALLMLFVVGLLCHLLFATTYNLLVIWPFFFTAGAMHDFIVNLGLPGSIGASLCWPQLGWALAIGVPASLWLYSRSARLRPESV